MRFINHKSHTRKCADAPIVGQARRRLKNLMRERSAYMGAEIFLHSAKPRKNFKHMKTYIPFSLLFILIFSSCVNSHKLIQNEKYEEAMALSLRRLAKGKVNSREIDALDISFSMIILKDKEEINALKNSGDPSVWPAIYTKALNIDDRQSRLEPVLRRLTNAGIESTIELYPAKALVKEAREKSAIFFYAKAQQYIITARNGDRQAARKAYYALERCRTYIEDFKDASSLSNEMYDLGTTHILVNPIPDKRDALFHEDLFAEVFANVAFPQRFDWQMIHLFRAAAPRVHFRADFTLGDFYVSPNGLSSSCCSRSEDIKVGEREVKVWSEKDSCYITEIEDIIETVSATVTDYEQYKRANLNVYFQMVEEQSSTIMRQEILEGRTSWSNDYSEFSGDARALGGLCDVSMGSPSSYPSGEGLLLKAACSVQPGIRRLFKEAVD